MGEKRWLDLDKCCLLCTAAAAPEICCLIEKTGLQDSLSVKHSREIKMSKICNNNPDDDQFNFCFSGC